MLRQSERRATLISQNQATRGRVNSCAIVDVSRFQLLQTF